MNDEDLKKMMDDIPLATELAKRRTLKESAVRFAVSRNAEGARSIRTSTSYRLAAYSLTAIALFSVLSYAVTQTSRSGGGDAGRETNLVNSASLTQYPSGIRTAIVRMVIGGADITKLEFNPPDDFISLTSVKQGVFHREGGGATYATTPADVMASNQSGEWIFNMELAVPEVGTAEHDVVAYLPGISDEICSKLNTELGLSEPIPQLQISQSHLYEKPMISGYKIPVGPAPLLAAPELSEQPFGCFRSHDGQTYVYYHVLVER